MKWNKDFAGLLDADMRNEKRIFCGEILVLVGVFSLLAVRVWLILAR